MDEWIDVTVEDLENGNTIIKCEERKVSVDCLDDSRCKHFDTKILDILLHQLLTKDYDILVEESLTADQTVDFVVDYVLYYLVNFDSLNDMYLSEQQIYPFLCTNCFIILIPRLHKYFMWIIKFLSYLDLKSLKSFAQQKMIHQQFLFVRNLVSKPFIIRYIMDNESIYILFFKYCIIMYKCAYIYSSDWHLWHEKERAIKIESQYPLCEQIRNEFNFGFFFQSSVYWDIKHIHCLESLDIEPLFTEQIIDKMWSEYYSTRRKWKYYFKRDKTVLFGMKFDRIRIISNALQFFIVRNYCLEYHKMENTLRRCIYLLTCKGIDNKEIKEIVYNDNIYKILSMCKDDKLLLCIWNRLNALVDVNDNDKVYNSSISEYTKEYNKRKKCMSHKCNNRKYDEKIDHKLRKFYICKGCKIAVYCSRHCQKYHWKCYHREQCGFFI